MAITKDSKPLGKYGRMRKTYLKEHQKVLYNQMLLDGSLWLHLREIDELANDMMDTIIERMKRERGVTEQLKTNDQWRWI